MRSLQFLLLVIATVAASAQYPSIESRREPAPTKLNQAALVREPRRMPQGFDPGTLFANLLSPDRSARIDAFQVAGLEHMSEQTVDDSRLLAVNIDSDSDLERILIVQTSGFEAAIVFDQHGGFWWNIGALFCCGISTSPSPVHRFFELKQIVWYGTNDIIVRAGGSQGSGVGERRLTIYRVWDGRLYKVFEAVESSYNMSRSDAYRFVLPDAESGSSSTGPPLLTVHRVGRPSATCVPYRWNSAQFTFVAVRPSPGICAAR